MDTLRRWWGKIKCWLGFHDPSPPHLIKLPPVNGHHHILERVLCTRCGQLLDLKPAGRIRVKDR